MAGVNGKMTIGPARSNAGYLNIPNVEKRADFEMLKKGVFGPLSKTIPGKTASGLGDSRDIDVSTLGCVIRKEITQGDQVDWTMRRRLKGGFTHGMRVPTKAGGIDFFHSTIKLNVTWSNAFQIMDEMEAMKLKAGLADDPKVLLEMGMTDLWSEYTDHEYTLAFLQGADRNLLASRADGGLAMNLGRGAGKQVLPLNCIVRGTGLVGGSTLETYHTNVKNALGTLDYATTTERISLSAIRELNEEISAGRFRGFNLNGKEGFLLILPAECRWMLMGDSTSEILDIAKFNATWGPNHPIFQYQPLQVGKITVIFSDSLGRYAPDVTGSEIVWGKDPDAVGFQDWGYRDLTVAQKQVGIGLLLGGAALRVGTNGKVRFTYEEGPHGVGAEVASNIKNSVVRTLWRDPEAAGEGALTGSEPISTYYDDSSMLFAFSMKAVSHGA